MSLRKRLTNFQASFRYRLFSVFTLLTALLSILLGTLYVTIEIRERRGYAAGQLQLLAQQLVFAVRLPLYAENRDALRRLAEQAVKAPHVHAVAIMSADGRLLADSHHPLHSRTESIVETLEVFSDPLATSVESTITGAVHPPAARIGYVRMERDTSDLSLEIRRLILFSLGIAVIFWLTVSCVCYLILRRVTGSFKALMEGIETMQSGNYASRINVVTSDEPGKAAHAVNQLADSLRQRDEMNYQLNRDLIRTNHSLELEIAERIQAEQAVRESEQSLKTLLDIMPVGVAWTDQDGKVEYLNHFFVERFGYSREEIRTEEDWYCHAYPDPDYRNQISELRRIAIEAGQRDCCHTPMFEAQVTCKDGDTQRQVITKFTISKKRTVIILIDITDRELMQEQLIKSQKLESIGILAGGIAHNFNNALTGVLGFISLATKNLDSSHKSHQLLQHAERATKRAAGMSKQLLTFARGDAPVKKPVSLRKLVEESAALTLNGANVRSLVQIPDFIHAVIADEGQLSQVFNNIAINAVQAMPNGGTLTINAENLIPATDAADSVRKTAYVRLSFTDEGHGIPEADLHRIFDPYFTTKASNTGLGLASVHSIVSKHGGQVLVESTFGKGTTFIIMLPSTGEEPESYDSVKESLRLPGQGSGSILVPDDEETVKFLV